MNEQGLLEVDGVRIEVRPRPTHDEAAALVTAIRTMLRSRRVERRETPSLWRLAGRRESLHHELEAGREGWRIAARIDI